MSAPKFKTTLRPTTESQSRIERRFTRDSEDFSQSKAIFKKPKETPPPPPEKKSEK